MLATSVGHSDGMLEAGELQHDEPGPRRAAQLAGPLRPGPGTARGWGAVFCTGSIAFAGALYDLGGHHEVARLLGNVLDRFRGTDPILDIAP